MTVLPLISVEKEVEVMKAGGGSVRVVEVRLSVVIIVGGGFLVKTYLVTISMTYVGKRKITRVDLKTKKSLTKVQAWR